MELMGMKFGYWVQLPILDFIEHVFLGYLACGNDTKECSGQNVEKVFV